MKTSKNNEATKPSLNPHDVRVEPCSTPSLSEVDLVEELDCECEGSSCNGGWQHNFEVQRNYILRFFPVCLITNEKSVKIFKERKEVSDRLDELKLMFTTLLYKTRKEEREKIGRDWGDEKLESLINDIRRNPSTDSVHIHKHVRSVLEKERERMVAIGEGLKRIDGLVGSQYREIFNAAITAYQDKIKNLNN